MANRFISEKQIEDKKRKRVEEWEEAKKQNPHLTGDAPPEESAAYDPRTLYERLQEQKMTKQAAYDEKYKFSNMIARIDDDDITFLETVDEDERQKERKKREELDREMETFRNHVIKVEEPTISKLAPSKAAPAAKKDFQKSALAHIVKKKKSSDESPVPAPAHSKEDAKKPAAAENSKAEAPSPSPKESDPPAKLPATGLLGIDYGSSSEGDDDDDNK